MIVRAAAEVDVGVIAIMSAQAFAAATGQALLAALLRLGDDAEVPVDDAEVPVDDAEVPVCVQLDYVSDAD